MRQRLQEMWENLKPMRWAFFGIWFIVVSISETSNMLDNGEPGTAALWVGMTTVAGLAMIAYGAVRTVFATRTRNADYQEGELDD